jgi:hypothetical protein
MQVFKTDKKIFWANELKSWLWPFAFAAFLFFVFRYLFALPNDNIRVGIVVIFLMKLADTLTQYHVREIQIDEQKKQMTVILNSVMSGKKIKQYELGQVTSNLITNSGLTKYFSSPFTLKIFLNPKDTFRLSNRYGFTLETLTLVDNTLKLAAT